MIMDINFGPSNVDLRQPQHVSHLRSLVLETIKKHPDVAEGVIVFDDVEHFFTYAVKGDMVEVMVLPRELAEEVLNEHDLTTYELFPPDSSEVN
jgi:hypothetical protein